MHDEFERRLAVREALAGLAALPELQREVMLSTAIDGSSHDEVAAALGLSQGAVRGLIYRARAALRAAAAALIPTPVVNWAARQELVEAGGRSSSLLDAVAGGGSAGIGGLLLKGGALVVSAGALATVTGIDSQHHAHPRGPARAVAAGPARATGSATTVPAGVAGARATVALVSVGVGSAHGERGGRA